jgi:hypothetical protein
MESMKTVPECHPNRVITVLTGHPQRNTGFWSVQDSDSRRGPFEMRQERVQKTVEGCTLENGKPLPSCSE